MRKLILALICLLSAIPCAARIITVDDDGPSDFNTIQAAINDANNGDIIEVQPGTYTGPGNRDIDFLGKAITVRSIDPNEPSIVVDTIIDCQANEFNRHRGFKFHSGEDDNSIISGFTITNGYGPEDYIEGSMTSSVGGAIYCYASAPMIRNCVITGNSAYNGGGICCCEGAAPIIENCTIVNNSGSGGGIYCLFSSPKLTNCVVSNNVAPLVPGFPGFFATSGAGIASYRSNPIITNCIISGNSASANGGGVYCSKGEQVISNCTISGNSALKGGAIICYCNCVMTITNCIIWGNTSLTGPQISLVERIGLCPMITTSYSNIQGGESQINGGSCWGGVHWSHGNIDIDPCFADPCNGDYHLKSQAGRWDPNSQTWVQDAVTSSCIDAGNPGCPLGDEHNDANNVRINMGAYGGTAQASKSPANWRSIADLTNDWVVDFIDLAVFVNYWLDSGQCLPSDLNRNQFVNFADFAIFGKHLSGGNIGEPGITYETSLCGFGPLKMAESGQTRFTVTVEGNYIHFEDIMVANCCADELWLEMDVTDNLITIYEREYGLYLCICICDSPVTATLGPFEPGIYTLEVYEDFGGFIGSTIVIIQ